MKYYLVIKELIRRSARWHPGMAVTAPPSVEQMPWYRRKFIEDIPPGEVSPRRVSPWLGVQQLDRTIDWYRRLVFEEMLPDEPVKRALWSAGLTVAAAAIIDRLPWATKLKLDGPAVEEVRPPLAYPWLIAPVVVVDKVPWLRKRLAEEATGEEIFTRRAWPYLTQPVALVDSLSWVKRQIREETAGDEVVSKRTWPYLLQPTVLAVDNLPWIKRQLRDEVVGEEVASKGAWPWLSLFQPTTVPIPWLRRSYLEEPLPEEIRARAGYLPVGAQAPPPPPQPPSTIVGLRWLGSRRWFERMGHGKKIKESDHKKRDEEIVVALDDWL